MHVVFKTREIGSSLCGLQVFDFKRFNQLVFYVLQSKDHQLYQSSPKTKGIHCTFK